MDVTKHDEIDDCNKANITVVETLHPTSRAHVVVGDLFVGDCIAV